jgi:hypothetical protein
MLLPDRKQMTQSQFLQAIQMFLFTNIKLFYWGRQNEGSYKEKVKPGQCEVDELARKLQI